MSQTEQDITDALRFAVQELRALAWRVETHCGPGLAAQLLHAHTQEAIDAGDAVLRCAARQQAVTRGRTTFERGDA